MLKKTLENVKEKKPIIHSITNYVTANDVANMILACGASPIMSDDPEEAKDISLISNALNLNIGTLNRASIHTMILSGQKANQLDHPIILDPVGVGASALRTDTVMGLIRGLKISVIKGNMSEIKALAASYRNSQVFSEYNNSAAHNNPSRGVDARTIDLVTEENINEAIEFVKWFAAESNTITIITGPIDLVSDGLKCCVIRNGNPLMEKVTGCGCQLSGLVAAFYAANRDNCLMACAAAVCAMGLAGEIAFNNMLPGEGNATYCCRIIDAIFCMDGTELEDGANIEIIE